MGFVEIRVQVGRPEEPTKDRLKLGTCNRGPVREDEEGTLARLSRGEIAMHGLHRAEGGLGGGDGQSKGSALKMLTGFNCDLKGMRDSCPKEGGAVGGMYRVGALTGV